MRNPYESINWSGFSKIMSMNHIHEVAQMINLYNKGVRHLPFSPYYPSSPRYYPITEKLANVPSDLMSSPNAEHHSVTDVGLAAFHFIGLGSFFASGSPSGQEPVGLQDSWRNGFANVLNHLQYEDGGGIIIAHPNSLFAKWNKFSRLMEMLDYDERVLGIEIYTHASTRNGYASDGTRNGTAFHIWDDVLSTGRLIYGFCTIDHTGFDTEGFGLDLGRNMLLVPEINEYECLKSYRNGAFYGALHGDIIYFTNIQATTTQVSVTVDSESEIRFISNRGIVKTATDTDSAYEVDDDDIFVRIEAHKDGEVIYSQPIMYKTQMEVQNEAAEKIARAEKRKRIIKTIILA